MNRKTIVVVIVIVSLVAALGYVGKYALEDKGLREMKKRIKVNKVIEEDTRLSLLIWQYKGQIAKINASADPNSP